MEEEIIEQTFIPNLKSVLQCKDRKIIEKIWDFFWGFIIGLEFEIWYCSICFMCYFSYFVYKLIGPIKDVPIIFDEYNLFDLFLFIGITLTVPIIIIYLVRLPERKVVKNRIKKWKEQGKYPMHGAFPGDIKTDGVNLYFESEISEYLLKGFSGNAYHEPITKIEIYEEKFGKRTELRMRVYYLENWKSSAEKIAEADGSLSDATEESIRNLLKFDIVVNKSNFK